MHKARHVIKSSCTVFYLKRLLVPSYFRAFHFTSGVKSSLKRLEKDGISSGGSLPSAIKHCKHNLCLEVDYSYDLTRNTILNLKFHSEKHLNFKHKSLVELQCPSLTRVSDRASQVA